MDSICGDKVKLRQITMDDVPELWTMIYGTKNLNGKSGMRLIFRSSLSRINILQNHSCRY